MGIRFYCPNGHRLNVKSFLAGKRGICPHCGVGVDIPLESQIPPGSKKFRDQHAVDSAKASGEAKVTEKSNGPLLALDEIEDEITTTGDSQILTQSAIMKRSGSDTTLPRPAPPNQATDQPGTKPSGASASAAANDFELPDSMQDVDGPAETTNAPTADPLAEDPNAVWYVRPPSGGQFGPAVGDVVRSWLDEGRITADSLVWREGWPEWQTADTVFPQLAKAPPVSSSTTSNSEPDSEEAPKKLTRRPPAKKNNQMGIIVVIVLGLLSLILLAVLIWMVMQSETSSPTTASAGYNSPQLHHSAVPLRDQFHN